jgi:hypothetical protein
MNLSVRLKKQKYFFASVFLSIIFLFFQFVFVQTESNFQSQSIPGKPEPVNPNSPKPSGQVRSLETAISNPGNLGSPAIWLQAGSGFNQTGGTWENKINNPAIPNFSQNNSNLVPQISIPGNQFSPISNNRAGGMNFQQSLNFNGGEKRLDSPQVQSSNVLGSGSYTIFVVARSNNSVGGTLLNFGTDTNCGGERMVLDTTGFQIGQNCSPGNRFNFSQQNLVSAQNRSQVFAINSQNSNVSLYLDGQNNGSSTGLGNAFSIDSVLQIGSAVGQNNFAGDISEIIIYPFSLGNNSMSEINTYLGVKYGVTLKEDYQKTSTPNLIYRQNLHEDENQTIYSSVNDTGFSLNTGQMTSSKPLGDRLVFDIAYRGGLEAGGYQFVSQKNGGDWSEITTDVPAGVTKRVNQVWHFTGSTPTRIMDMWTDITGFSSSFTDYRIIESDTPNMADGVAFTTSSAFLGDQFVPVHTFVNGKYYSLGTGISDSIGINRQVTSDSTPRITGTVGRCCTPIQVTINNQTYNANNYGSWWELPDNVVDSLDEGIYDVVASYQNSNNLIVTDTTIDELVIDKTPPTSIFLKEPDLIEDLGEDQVIVQATDNYKLNHLQIAYTNGVCDDTVTEFNSFDLYPNENPASINHRIVSTFYNGLFVCAKTTDLARLTSYIVSTNPINIRSAEGFTITNAPNIIQANQSSYSISGTCQYDRGNSIDVYINQNVFDSIINLSAQPVSFDSQNQTLPTRIQSNEVFISGFCSPDNTFTIDLGDLSNYPDGDLLIELILNQGVSSEGDNYTSVTINKNTSTSEIDLDGDNDGVSDSMEQNGPNNGDGNNDGIRDQDQSNVVALPYEEGFVVTEISTNSNLEDCYQLDQISVSGASSLEYSNPERFISGLVDFKAICSGSMKVKIYWFTDFDLEKVKLVKCDLSIRDESGKCKIEEVQDVLYSELSIAGKKVIYTEYVVTDQGYGDTDPTVSIIADPVALVTSDADSNSNSSNSTDISNSNFTTINNFTSLIRTGGKSN